MRIAEVC